MKSSKKEKRPKTAVIYTRVSTDEQAATGYSLIHQEEALRYECQARGIEIVKHFQDDGYSAKSLEKRPAFQKFLDYIDAKDHPVDYLYVTRWDRFSRNIMCAYVMMAQLQSKGIEIKCLKEKFDMNDPAASMLRALKMGESEMDNRRRSINTKMGMQRAKKDGRYVSGTPPKGYKWSRDTKHKPIIVHDIDAHLVLEAFELYASGLFSVESVRKNLLDKGLKISKSQFYEMLRNPVYAGFIVVKGRKTN